MTSVTVEEFADDVMRYLSSVRQGEIVVVTEAGRPIARLVRDSDEASTSDDSKCLDDLAARGLLRRATADRRKTIPPPPKVGGKPLSEIVIEDRR